MEEALLQAETDLTAGCPSCGADALTIKAVRTVVPAPPRPAPARKFWRTMLKGPQLDLIAEPPPAPLNARVVCRECGYTSPVAPAEPSEAAADSAPAPSPAPAPAETAEAAAASVPEPAAAPEPGRSAPPAVPSGLSPEEQVRWLAEQRDAGALSQQEFDAAATEILRETWRVGADADAAG